MSNKGGICFSWEGIQKICFCVCRAVHESQCDIFCIREGEGNIVLKMKKKRLDFLRQNINLQHANSQVGLVTAGI